MQEQLGLILMGVYPNAIEGCLADFKMVLEFNDNGEMIIRKKIIKNFFKYQFSSNTVIIGDDNSKETAKKIVTELIKIGVKHPNVMFRNKQFIF